MCIYIYRYIYSYVILENWVFVRFLVNGQINHLVENSPYPPDPPIVGDSSIGELNFEFVNQISQKNPKKE